MFANGHYLIDTTGDYVYLLELIINQSRYAVQLNAFLIDTAIAAANVWVLPAGATWAIPTAQAILPYITIFANNNFGALIGFSAGSFPTAAISGIPPAQTEAPVYAISQAILSTTAPQVTPYSSFLVYCNLVNNKAVIPSQLIYSFTPTDSEFGALEVFAPTAELGWNKIESGQYTGFTIEFRDQLGNPVAFQDPNTLITLFTKNKDDVA
jgi:hypothetical protein